MLGVADFSFLDTDELGYRPNGWDEDVVNAMDFDETTAGELFSMKIDRCLKSNTSDDEDESAYDIDPETGKRLSRSSLT